MYYQGVIHFEITNFLFLTIPVVSKKVLKRLNSALLLKAFNFRQSNKIEIFIVKQTIEFRNIFLDNK